MQPRQRLRRGNMLRAVLLSAATILPSFPGSSLARVPVREPPLLNQRQADRGIDGRLQSMRQRHESNRAARQAAKAAANRGRAVAEAEPALTREPAELSVQPLPAASE